VAPRSPGSVVTRLVHLGPATSVQASSAQSDRHKPTHSSSSGGGRVARTVGAKDRAQRNGAIREYAREPGARKPSLHKVVRWPMANHRLSPAEKLRHDSTERQNCQLRERQHDSGTGYGKRCLDLSTPVEHMILRVLTHFWRGWQRDRLAFCGVLSFHTVKIQHIRTEVLAIPPLDATQEGLDRIEQALVPQFSEDPFIQIRLHVEDLDLSIDERQSQSVIGIGLYVFDSRVHMRSFLAQGINSENNLAVAGKLPVRQQLVLMYLDPGLYKLHLAPS
jgi:hypothetical protein